MNGGELDEMAESKTLPIPEDVLDQSVAALYAAMRMFKVLPPAMQAQTDRRVRALNSATQKLDQAIRKAREGSNC